MSRLAALAGLAGVLLSACCSTAGPARCPDPPPPPPPCGDPQEAPPEPAEAYEAAPESLPTDRQRRIEVIAFGADDKIYAVRVEDELIGQLFEVRSLKTGEVIAAQRFDPDLERDAWRKLDRAHHLDVEPVSSQQNPTSEVALVTADEDRWFTVFAVHGERIIPYYRIPLLRNAQDEPARARAVQVVWHPDGRYAVVVHHQELDVQPPFASDYAHAFPVRSYRLGSSE